MIIRARWITPTSKAGDKSYNKDNLFFLWKDHEFGWCILMREYDVSGNADGAMIVFDGLTWRIAANLLRRMRNSVAHGCKKWR